MFIFGVIIRNVLTRKIAFFLQLKRTRCIRVQVFYDLSRITTSLHKYIKEIKRLIKLYKTSTIKREKFEK